MNIDGSRVLVTGSARRVGRRIAERFAEAGADVAVHYNTSGEAAEEVADALASTGARTTTVQGDLGDVDEVEAIVDGAADGIGGLDVLVNSASVFPHTPVGSVAVEEWDGVADVNLRAPFFASQAAAERMDGGTIVNIADWAGIRPYEGYVPYCITKAGVIAMTKGLARALSPSIAVNAVAPGPVLLPPDYDDEARERVIDNTPLGRIGEPDDVADGVLFFARNDFTTGAILPIDGGRLIA